MDTVAPSLVFPHAQPPAHGTATPIMPGVLWFRLPLPYRLDHVNIYLIEDTGGWAVLDTGPWPPPPAGPPGTRSWPAPWRGSA
jgi:hypothetical protein